MIDITESIKYTKLITDSDIDGVLCAVMLKRAYPEIKIFFSSPSAFQDDDLPTEVDENTIISDLPYAEGAGLYFDHHISNKPTKAISGKWEAAPSAARVIFECYRKIVPLTDLVEFLEVVDKFDSGNLKREDVKNPSFYLKLIFSTKKIKYKFYKHLIEILVEEGPTALEDDMEVASEIGEFEKMLDQLKHDLKNSVEIYKEAAFINLIDKPYSNIHVSLFQNELINSKIFVLFKKDKTGIRITMFDNNLLENSRRYDLLSVAQQMNPKQSGGHRSGCGFSMPKDLTIEECIKKLKIFFDEMMD